MQIRNETTKNKLKAAEGSDAALIPVIDQNWFQIASTVQRKRVKTDVEVLGLSLFPSQKKLAGTHGWSGHVSPRTDSVFVGQCLSVVHCPPALFLELERERTKKEKEREEVLHLFRCYTHTPGRSQVNPERQKEEKSGHTKGKRPKTAQGGEGNRRTSGTNLHGETDLNKTAHTPKPNDTLRRGTRGKLGTKWGTSWWQTEKTKQLIKQDSVPSYLDVVRYAIPGPWSILAPIGIKRLYEFQRIRCTICFTSPKNHQRKETTPASRVLPGSCVVTWCNVIAKVAAKKGVSDCSQRLHSGRQESRRVTLGQQEQRDSAKTVENRMAICYTLLKRITKLKCVNSEVKSVKHLPHNGGSLKWVHGTMSESPWKSH